MVNESVLREARARIKEIDQQLAQYERLVEERKVLQGVVDWYAEGQGQTSLFRTSAAVLQLVGRANRFEIADKRFHPRPDSITSKTLEATVKLLERAPDHTLPFPMIADSLPRDIVGNGAHWREGIRTAIKRAGGRYGIVYEGGGVVRLVTKNPRAAGA